MSDLQHIKKIVRAYYKALDNAPKNALAETLKQHTDADYCWRGMYPFGEQKGADRVAAVFWEPLREAFTSLQRREDIFFAGHNDCDGGQTQWTASMGHLMGLFDSPWLDIPPTGKIAMLRYAEFHRIDNSCIIETALFVDVISVMHQAGRYPLPPMTGVSFIYPGPRTHDGLLLDPHNPKEGEKTLALINKMLKDLDLSNRSGEDHFPPDKLMESWHDDMIWYGPCGIGASYTIPRYQQQHQYPFRKNLTSKRYNGHIARIAEGCYGGFFGWPNLNNRNKGGFLGLTASEVHAPMRIVDIYRREGDKLAENWVFIDFLYYLKEQGLDVLERMRANTRNS